MKTIREHFGKNYEASDIRKSIIAALSIKVMEPVFESQTKTKLGSTDMGGDLPTVRTYINDFMAKQLDNFLHKNPSTADAIQRKIIQAEKERKELSGIRKLARERAKKASLHNKKLRDCRVHLGDLKKDSRLDSTLFITEEIRLVVRLPNHEMSILRPYSACEENRLIPMACRRKLSMKTKNLICCKPH